MIRRGLCHGAAISPLLSSPLFPSHYFNAAFARDRLTHSAPNALDHSSSLQTSSTGSNDLQRIVRYDRRPVRGATAPVPAPVGTRSGDFRSCSDRQQHLFQETTAEVPGHGSTRSKELRTCSGYLRACSGTPQHLFRNAPAPVPSRVSTCSRRRQHLFRETAFRRLIS